MNIIRGVTEFMNFIDLIILRIDSITPASITLSYAGYNFF